MNSKKIAIARSMNKIKQAQKVIDLLNNPKYQQKQEEIELRKKRNDDGTISLVQLAKEHPDLFALANETGHKVDEILSMVNKENFTPEVEEAVLNYIFDDVLNPWRGGL